MVSLRSISTVLTSALLVQASKNALVAPVHEAPKQDFAESKPHLEPRYEIAPGAAGLSQGALNTLGLVAGVVGLISSGIGLANFFMEKYKRRGPEFQIKLGLSPPNGTAHGTEFGGKIKDVQAYDAFNRKLGDTGSKKIRDGGLWISHLPDKDYGVQVDFMSVEADEKDALCISWITLTNYGNLDAAGGLWNGDIGRACGETWYPGNQIAGAHKDGSKWRPACTWIGGTKNKKGKDTWAPIKSMAIKWAVHEYIEDRAVKTLEDNRVCRSTLFTDKPDILETMVPETSERGGFSGGSPEVLPQNNGTQNIKRGVPAWSEGDHTMHGVPRYPWMDTELIVSENQWDHNATELCNDKMSYGPDFIGSDGYWCDMDKRQVLPICKFHQVEGCIELDFDSNALKKRSTVARRNLLSHHKSYESITNWG